MHICTFVNGKGLIHAVKPRTQNGNKFMTSIHIEILYKERYGVHDILYIRIVSFQKSNAHMLLVIWINYLRTERVERAIDKMRFLVIRTKHSIWE